MSLQLLDDKNFQCLVADVLGPFAGSIRAGLQTSSSRGEVRTCSALLHNPIEPPEPFSSPRSIGADGLHPKAG